MAGDASKIYRDKGELTIFSSACGYTSAASPGFNLRIMHSTEPKLVEEMGDTPIGEYHRGFVVTAVVYLAQRDAATFAAAFRGHSSGATFKIDADTVACGTDLVQSASYYGALSWVGTNFTVTGYKVLGFPLPDEALYFGNAREQNVPVFIKFYPDGSNQICQVA